MAIALCNELTAVSPASAAAGLTGSPNQARSTQIKGHVQNEEFSFTIPSSGAGSASGDQIIIGYISVYARVKMIALRNDALGSGVTLSFGKTDPNNSANNDNVHYLDPIDASVASSQIYMAKNIPEQIGTDATGAVTDTGNAVPGFGALPIEVVLTIAGTPTSGAKIAGWTEYVDRP